MVTISLAGSLGSGRAKSAGLARDAGIDFAVGRFHGEVVDRSLRHAFLRGHLRRRVVRGAEDEIAVGVRRSVRAVGQFLRRDIAGRVRIARGRRRTRGARAGGVWAGAWAHMGCRPEARLVRYTTVRTRTLDSFSSSLSGNGRTGLLAPSRVLREHLVLAYIIAIAALQFAENDRRKDGQRTQQEKRLMNSVDHLGRARMEPVWNEKSRRQRRRRNAETDRHLLHRAGNAAGASST